MKKNSLIKICGALAFICMSIVSCLQKPEDGYIKSEVTVPGGAVNYFENAMDFGFEGGEKVLSFKSNLRWNLKIANTQNGVQWLTIEPLQGNSGSNKVTFSIQENATYEDRSATVNFYAGDTIRTIKVNQERLQAIILPSDRYDITADGCNLDININHSTDYNVTIPEEYRGWIHLSASETRGLEASKITINVDPNPGYEKREGKLIFTAKDEEEVVTISQAGMKAVVTIPTEEFIVDELGGTINVEVYTNIDCTITSNNDWIKEVANTRGLTSLERKFKVDALDATDDREGTITVANEAFKYNSTITVKQRNTFYLDNKSLDILIGKEKILTVKNTTNQGVEWSSNNTAVATVAANGYVKGISKGTAKITAKTTDGKHVATCMVNVCEVTDMISIKSGGTVTKEGDLVKQGSIIKWAIKNNSPVKVTLKSMQLSGSKDNEISNEYYANEDIASESSVTKATTIDASSGLHLPITCHFVFVYNGKEYPMDAKYE